MAHGSGSYRQEAGTRTAARTGEATAAHKTLGLELGATAEQIAAAYRRMAQLYRPDKVAGLGQELRDMAEARMKEINQAYEVLNREEVAQVRQ